MQGPNWPLMSLKVIYFQSIFLIDFYIKKTDLYVEIWNNSPNYCEAGNSRARRNCSKRSEKLANERCRN